MKIRTLIDMVMLLGMLIFGLLSYKNVKDYPDQTLFPHCCEVQCDHEECNRQRELYDHGKMTFYYAIGSILCFCYFIGPKLDFSHCFIVVSFPMN